MNYAKEVIPDPKDLVLKAKELASTIEMYPKYKLLELFNEVERKGTTEYHRNQKVWSEKIKYNTWDKGVLEELEKHKSVRRKMNEVKGLYVFYEGDKPIYVGISRGILRRLKNHFLGKTHFEASLVYLMLRDEYDNENEHLYSKKREDFKLFIDNREKVQQQMRDQWRISIIPKEDNYEMYFTECYLACHLKAKWNSFETH